MENKVDLMRVTWHSTVRLVLSIRGLVALLFSVFMVSMVTMVYNDLPPAFFELFRLFTSDVDLQFQWFLFDSSLSKLITLFIAPMFIFDAISGDRSDDRFGLMLTKPLSRPQYMIVKVFSAFLAFGLVFLPVMVLGYPVFMGIVSNLTLESYFGTCLLFYLLAFFTMCVGLLISTLTKKNLVSFIAMFGLMAVIMMPNAMKYTSSSFEGVAMATPHYYATYFTSHPMDAALCAAYACAILLFSVPFLLAAVWKFNREDL